MARRRPTSASARRSWRERPARWLLAVTFMTGGVVGVGAGTQAMLGATASEGSAAGAAPADKPAWPSLPTEPTPSTTGAPAPTTTTTLAPAPPPIVKTIPQDPPLTPLPRQPGRVFVVGDSVTVQAAAEGPGLGAPADVEISAWLGWSAVHAQPSLDAAVAARPVDVLVIALGLNDSTVGPNADGWSATDVERFRQMIATPGADACVVLVLPGHGLGVGPQYRAELTEARLAILDLALERRELPGAGPTVVVDWQAEVDGRPELLAPDGIHLANDPGTEDISADAAAARTSMYWDGVGQCATP